MRCPECQALAVFSPHQAGYRCVACEWRGGQAAPPAEQGGQPDLFAKTHTHKGDPETSTAAAHAAQSLVDSHKSTIMDVLRRLGPQAVEEVAGHCALESLQVTRRMSDLKNDGRVRDSGLRHRNANGRQAVRWELV